ncbi:hypothetical protein GCM10010429_37370 [Micromonospora olivasterospora]
MWPRSACWCDGISEFSVQVCGSQDWDNRQGTQAGLHRRDRGRRATERFLEFAEAWGRKYPAIVRLWEDAWALPLLVALGQLSKRGAWMCGGPHVGGMARVADVDYRHSTVGVRSPR